MLLIFVQLKEILSMFLLCYHQLKSYFCKMVFFGFLLKWSRVSDSNRPPVDYKSTALPNELTRHNQLLSTLYNLTLKLCELKGFAPSTTRVRTGCSANLAYSSNLVLVRMNIKKASSFDFSHSPLIRKT